MYRTIFAALITIIVYGCSNAQSSKQQTGFSAKDFAAKIDREENVQVVDVRTADEFEQGHLENAINVDWNSEGFDKGISGLDKSKPVYVYCLSGGRSKRAASHMREAGFKQVFEMPGGMMEWRANNLPEITGTKKATGMSMEQYNALINSEKPVLVDFFAEWCVPCKKMKPYLDKIATEQADKVTVVRIDADDNTQLCKEIGIVSLPVLRLYRNKVLVWEKTGFAGEEEIRQQLK